MVKIFLIYGHYNNQSFNAAIKEKFITTAKENGHDVDCIDLYKENFDPVYSGENPTTEVLDHRKRIEKCDVITLIAPIWNFRMPAIVEGWIDKVLAPPWAFTFKKLVGNYGYPLGNLKNKKAINAVKKGIAAKHNKVIAAEVLVIEYINEIIAIPKPQPPTRPDTPTFK